jgi:hypothetical protein
MKTVSLQTMPNGFEFELPSFGYWFKAGVAFTLGAGAIYVLGVIAWLFLLNILPALGAARMLRII